MADVAWTTFVGALAADTIGGSEKIPVLDGTAKHITPDLLVTYVIAQRVAATVQTPTTGDELHGDRSGTSSVFTLDAVSDYAIARGWTQASDGAPVTSADELLIDRSGTKYQIDVDDLTTYVNSAVLDLTALAAATPSASDLLLFGSGATPKKITLSNLETQLWSDLSTYISGLTKVTTTASTDEFLVIQGGAAKHVTPVELATYFDVPDGDVIGPLTTTTNNIPQWDTSTKTLKDGLTLVTTVRDTSTAVDTAIPTEQAVRELVGSIEELDIDGGTDIGAALSDADLIIVDDGGAGTNRKSAVSRIWDYIVAKIQATVTKAVPVDADILMIQDSANANTLTELTVGNLKSYLSSAVGV